MRAVLVIAKNTYREIIRDRILYGIVVFALLLLGLSIALGELSFAEQARISADFGFTGIQLGISVLAIFVGSSLVAREIDKQTILTLLARPLTRSQFLLGKFLGLSGVMVTVLIGLAMVLAGLVSYLELALKLNFLVAMLGIFIEALLLLSIAMFFGTFARPMMTVIFSVSLFLLGHWVSSLAFFVEKSPSGGFKLMGQVIGYVVPNLERFNRRSLPVYDTDLPMTELFSAVGYGAGWLLLILGATSLIFQKRDFV